MYYFGFCQHCGYRTAPLPDSYAAVITDAPDESPVAGSTLSHVAGVGFIQPLEPTRPRRIEIIGQPPEPPVAHPGCSWTWLFLQGKFVRVRSMVCRCCGTTFERRRLEPPVLLGCLPCLIGGVALAIALSRGKDLCFIPVASLLLAGMLWVVAGVWLARLYLWVRFRDRNAKLAAADAACLACGSDDIKPIVYRRPDVHCPACHENAMKFHNTAVDEPAHFPANEA